MLGEVPVCVDCLNLRETPNTFVCLAFPNGIPVDIIVGGNPHTDYVPGDGGIRFEQRKES
jgi:hypothetical protein